MYISLFGPNLGYSQNTKDEQGVKIQFKGIYLLISPKPLKQL